MIGIFKTTLVIIICVLASIPLGLLSHEFVHWFYPDFGKDNREPKYICYNPQTYTGNPEDVGLLFVVFDARFKDCDKEKSDDCMTKGEFLFEELIAYIIMIGVMALLTYFFLRQLLPDEK